MFQKDKGLEPMISKYLGNNLFTFYTMCALL
jgi:hypothetical protein